MTFVFCVSPEPTTRLVQSQSVLKLRSGSLWVREEVSAKLDVRVKF